MYKESTITVFLTLNLPMVFVKLMTALRNQYFVKAVAW